MFWTGCGPADADTAIACSVAHDSHNVWSVGSSDAAMALAVNRLQEIDGGWVLVHHGAVVAEVRFEIGGLMTARSAEAFDVEVRRMKRTRELGTIDGGKRTLTNLGELWWRLHVGCP